MHKLSQWVVCGLLCVVLQHMAVGEAEDPVLKSFETDQTAVQTAIKTGDLAQALVATSSVVFNWKSHPGFMDLVKSLITTFGFLPADPVKAQYQFMRTQLEGKFFGTGWLEAGMMAHAVDDYVTAASCYSQIRFNGSLATIPYPRVLLGKALLAQGRIHEATQAYESAIQSASNDQAGTFRIRYEYALDLLTYDRVIESVDRFFVSRQSPYLLERLWANEELLLYMWALGDKDSAGVFAGELARKLPDARPRGDIAFEGRRMKTAADMQSRYVRAMAGEDLATLSLDEESMVYPFRRGEYEVIISRLEPWVVRYPLREYARWSQEQKHVATWTHQNLHAAECLAGRHDQAIAGFEEILAWVPVEERPDMHVNAWCWRGYALMLMQGRWLDAKQSFEFGLSQDAQFANPELPSGFLQPRIDGGRAPCELRAAYVANYKCLLETIRRMQERRMDR